MKHLLSNFIGLLFFATVTIAQTQVPETQAGRLYSDWRRAQDSGDRAAIQQFIEKSMPWGHADQVLAMGRQSGGYDIRRVESSTETSLVVLVQERGGARQFFRIALSVSSDGKQIEGIRVQVTQPPPELAPAKMAAAEADAARKGVPFRKFSEWIDAFNSGDRDRLGEFLKANFPSAMLDAQMGFRERTGGLELRALEQATDTSLVGLVQERASDQFGRFSLVIEAEEPHRITRLPVVAIPRPAEFALARMNDEDLIKALRKQLEEDAARDRFSGTVLLAKNGKVLFSGAYGLADRENKTANRSETRFRIGSMSKMFTAVSIVQLIQTGKIKLTDPVGKYITDYPNRDIAAKVTIHQLLTHTGGTGDFFGPEYDAHRLELRTLNDYVSIFGTRAPAFEPGSRYAYSNYGMVLLGIVIERVSGKSYYDYVTEQVFKPAGMTSTGSPLESEKVPDRSTGYMRPAGAGTWVTNANTLPYRATSAGGALSTVTDLMKFAETLTAHKLLNAQYTDLLITGKVDTGNGRKYAYGFEDGRKDGAGAVGHSGGAPGMSGDLRIYPQSGYVVAVLSNFDPPAAPRVSAFVEARLGR